MASGLQIDDYIQHGNGPPTGFIFGPGLAAGVPSLGTASQWNLYEDVLTGNIWYYNQSTTNWTQIPIVPTGGSTGQVLTKHSGTTYDYQWSTPSGANPSLLLDFQPSADQLSLTTMTSGSWYDICANQSFTVTNAAAQIMVCVGGNAFSDGSSGTNFTRINIDSAGSPFTKPLGGMVCATYVNPFSGCCPIGIGVLSAAAHTIKVQVSTNNTGNRCRLQPTTQAAAQEFLRIQVWQLG